MKFRRSGITLTVLLILALRNAGAMSTGLQQARVRRVMAGYTIEVEFADLRTEAVRYIGIDTPETHVRAILGIRNRNMEQWWRRRFAGKEWQNRRQL